MANEIQGTQKFFTKKIDKVYKVPQKSSMLDKCGNVKRFRKIKK